MISAETPSQQTWARAYAGLNLAVNGEWETAKGHLKWVKDKGSKQLSEYVIAVSGLEYIKKNKP